MSMSQLFNQCSHSLDKVKRSCKIKYKSNAIYVKEQLSDQRCVHWSSWEISQADFCTTWFTGHVHFDCSSVTLLEAETHFVLEQDGQSKSPGSCGGGNIKVFLIFPSVLMSCLNKSAVKPNGANHAHPSSVVKEGLRSFS